MSELPLEESSPVTRGSFTIRCEASGIPIPTVHWEKDGASVNQDSSIPGVFQIISDAVAIMNIERAVETDDGTFRCIAMNAIGNSNTTKLDDKSTRVRGEKGEISKSQIPDFKSVC